jgi:pimeloyl-ACP methyl ester carboxylesterase
MDNMRALTMPDGAVISYQLLRGESPQRLLVLLHGVASNATRWSEFVTHTHLRTTWDILRLDLRGMGRSIYRGRIGMAEWCGDLATILAAEGYTSAVVVGHCLGANIAVEFSTRYPEQVEGLALIEPMPHQALKGSMRQIARLRLILLLVLWIVRALNAAGFYRRRIEFLDLEQLDSKTRTAIAAGQEAGVVFEKYASPLFDLRTTSTGAFLQGLIAVTGRLPDFSAISVPVLTLLSSHSTFIDPARIRSALAALLHNKIIEIEARHWIPTEQPDAMRLAIERWIAHI